MWNIIRTAPCCVLYDSCAQRYAHEYQQLLNLCFFMVKLLFVCFYEGLVCNFVCSSVSLAHFGFVFSKLV